MSHCIKVKEREITFLDEDKTILNALEKADIESHFHCRDGFCGACRCTLKKGSVEYHQYPLAFVGENEILTCCAYPTSDLELDID